MSRRAEVLSARRALCRALLGVACACAMLAALPARGCVPLGQWTLLMEQRWIQADTAAVLDKARDRRVVLLGESHESAEHHRWQLHTLAALHARRPQIAIAFEMFPRSVQSVLDAWVAGELDETTFLERSRWYEVWGYDAAHYLPLFHFARMHRIPMIALNVERDLVRRVGREGFDAVPPQLREGVGRPAAAGPDYLRELHGVYLQHGSKQSSGLDDPAFLRFVAGQQTWDRAMAEAMVAALARYPQRQVVAILGRGHSVPGAVPHQLRSLGVQDVAVFLPWDRGPGCQAPQPGMADAVFGVVAHDAQTPARPRLGVALSQAEAGARIDRVAEGSVAAQAGLQVGDLLIAVAGRQVVRTQEVLNALARQAPGTWLPLKVRRDGNELELVAKFPH